MIAGAREGEAPARVFVAMSGGVDSSVAAALLVERGFEVVGVTMQIWPSADEEGGCCSVSAVRDARRVCDRLGIAHYALNFRRTFKAEVVDPFVEAYSAGRTPNPCIVCNDRVKFTALFDRVRAQGADYLATGHYARIVDRDGHLRLARGADASKDQSYFLYRMSEEQLGRTLFPVGELAKDEVRSVAERLGLHVADKPESQDTCFATAEGHLGVLGARSHGGDIVDREGRVLGRHDGVERFTVGQRKGLGIGGSAEPLYVLSVDASTRRVVVGGRESLAVREVIASDPVWHGSDVTSCVSQVRYRMEPVASQVTREGEALRVRFAEPIYGVAPGQAVVCYEDGVVLGGGTIECAS